MSAPLTHTLLNVIALEVFNIISPFPRTHPKPLSLDLLSTPLAFQMFTCVKLFD